MSTLYVICFHTADNYFLSFKYIKFSTKSAFMWSFTLLSSKGLFPHSGNCFNYPSTLIFPHTNCFHVTLHFSFPKTLVSTFRTKYLATASSFPLRDFCPLSMNNLLLAFQVAFVLTSTLQSSQDPQVFIIVGYQVLEQNSSLLDEIRNHFI